MHFGLTVEQQALPLDAECCKRVIIVDDRDFAFDRRGERLLILPGFRKQALYLVKLPALYVIRIQNPVAELFRTLGCAAVAKVEHRLAPVCDPLPGPHLCLIGAGQKSGYVVPLRPHDRFGDPEVLLL